MKTEQKQRKLKALKADVQKLEQAHKTISAEDTKPAELIAAMQLILAAYKTTARRLTRELRTMIRNIVKLTAVGKATDEHRALIDLWRTNVIELAAQITALECGLYLHQQWANVKPAPKGAA